MKENIPDTENRLNDVDTYFFVKVFYLVKKNIIQFRFNHSFSDKFMYQCS